MIEILRFIDESGEDVFGDWLAGLRDNRAAAKIAVRINRMAAGNFGDCKSLREGVSELRIDWGPGYRVYYAMVGKVCVVLLGGGDKRRQSADIDRAIENWNSWLERNKKSRQRRETEDR
jgi:putative addiction module killer protein